MDQFTYFWCLIIISMTFFLIGIYKNVVIKIGYIFWVNKKAREDTAIHKVESGQGWVPKKQTILNEAIFQNRIKERSKFLWARHSLIFFGFMIIFVLDLTLTFAGHYAHHYLHIEYFFSGAGRGLLKFGMEASGALLFVGLTLGLTHRLIYAQEEKKFIDIRLLFLLWLVVATGFLTEAFRLAAEPADPLIAFSFLGEPLAGLLRTIPWHWAKLAIGMWITHASITAIFFAYIPFSKFVHMLAAPLGRSITQDGDYGKRKRATISEGLL
jgi:nitrate reductase gamma subunit